MNKNLLLINPRISERSQNKKIKDLINITFPTSLGSLAGFLLDKKIVDVAIVDEQLHPFNDQSLMEHLQNLATPKIVGISVLTLNSGRAYELAKKIKKIDSSVTTILGGIHPTVLPNEVAQAQGVDIVVRGEAEETLKEIVSNILIDKSVFDIAGISYFKSGKVVHTKDRALLKDLDKIPPFPYRLFENDLDRYPNFSGIFGSRGCPYNCSFCSSRSISGKKYRYHSVERVVSEIKILVETYKQTSIFMMDDNIGVNKKHFVKLCDRIIEENLHKKAFFHGSLRGDNATDELLDKAKEANFKILYYGLETASERLMKNINKGESVAQVADAIKRSAQKGFSVGTTIIFGLPTETRKERYDAMRLVKTLPLSSVRFNTLTPYPGTPVYKDEFSKGNIKIKENWENFGVQYMWESDDIPYVPEGTDRIELIFDTMWANFSYYVSLKGIKRMLTEKYAGGNVIKLNKKWYLSWKQLYKMSLLFLYLAKRFSIVSLKTVFKSVSFGKKR